MNNLNKAISLNQAAKITGYHSDYLSSLIRKGEIKGEKIGGSWFTTHEEIKNYIFKQKVRHQKFAVVDFVSPKRTKKVFIFTTIVFVSILLLGIYFYGKNTKVILQEEETKLSSDPEVIN